MLKSCGVTPLRRGWLVALLVAAQLALLGAMAGKREYIRAYGTELYLRTAPLDPRDPFRGDFVRLDYALSTVHPRQTRGQVAAHREQRDYPVFARLAPGPGGIYALDYLTDARPDGGPFLKGRIQSSWDSWRGAGIKVRYGIEQYYVQQGEGRRIEQQRGGRDQVQVPMEVRIALGADGTAVLKDFRWSALGIQLELLRFNRRGPDGRALAPAQPLSPRVRLSLHNVADRPLRLADPAAPCAVRLEPVSWAAQRYRPADERCDAQPPPAAGLTLAPGASHSLELELGAPPWRVFEGDGATPREIGALDNPAQFRLVYRSLDPTDAGESAGSGVAAATNPWHGELPSRAFTAFGQVD